MARLKANRLCTVQNDCGLAVSASRIIPNPSARDLNSTIGYVSQDGGFDHPGEVSVCFQFVIGQVEVVDIPVEAVFLVECEESVSSRVPSTAASRAWVRKSLPFTGVSLSSLMALDRMPR